MSVYKYREQFEDRYISKGNNPINLMKMGRNQEGYGLGYYVSGKIHKMYRRWERIYLANKG